MHRRETTDKGSHFYLSNEIDVSSGLLPVEYFIFLCLHDTIYTSNDPMLSVLLGITVLRGLKSKVLNLPSNVYLALVAIFNIHGGSGSLLYVLSKGRRPQYLITNWTP